MGKKTLHRLKKVVKSKFFIASVLFLIWIVFFDEHSLITQKKNREQLNNLIEQQTYYKEKIESDLKKMQELNSGIEELEKYAREQFYMSKPNEDLFIVVPE